jgi:dipeptidyl aminopeptidase/acylaminoacyl peptidase
MGGCAPVNQAILNQMTETPALSVSQTPFSLKGTHTLSPKMTALPEPSKTPQSFPGALPSNNEPFQPEKSAAAQPVLKVTSFPENWQIAMEAEVGENGKGIYILDGKTKAYKKITGPVNPSVVLLGPTWSPDGKKIAYFRNGIGFNHPDLYVVNSDGSGEEKVTNGDFPSWSPDGKEIVFLLNNDIYKINLQTHDIQPLRLTKDKEENFPVWSPDGKSIAFLSANSILDKMFELIIIQANGQVLQNPDFKPLPGYSPISWSPDGKKIAYRSAGVCGAIYVYDIINNTTQKITNNLGKNLNPAWSPDGDWLVYDGTPPEKLCVDKNGSALKLPHEIYLIKKDGSNFQKMDIPNEFAWATSPVFSPVVPLELNKKYIVTVLGDKLLLRDKPSLTASYSKVFAPGAQLLTLEGPQMGGKDTWWRVKEVSTGLEGWVREGAGWLRPAGQETEN